MKVEDRSQEKTERKERCARGDAWWLAKNILKLTETDKATFFSPTNEWCLPAPSVITPEETVRVVNSGASTYMLRKKDLNSAVLETVKVSKSPTKVVTANGEVLTKEEATVCVKELDLFVAVKLLEDTLAVLSLGKLCEDHGHPNHWTSGPKQSLIKDGRRMMQHGELRTDRCPWFLDKLLKLIYTNISNIIIAGICSSCIASPHQQEVRVQVAIERVRGDPSREPEENPNLNKKRQREGMGRPVAWSARMVRRIYGESCGWKCSRTQDAPASSSRESALEPRSKVVSNQNNEGPCRRLKFIRRTLVKNSVIIHLFQ